MRIMISLLVSAAAATATERPARAAAGTGRRVGGTKQTAEGGGVGALGGSAPVFKGSRAVIITAYDGESRLPLT